MATGEEEPRDGGRGEIAVQPKAIEHFFKKSDYEYPYESYSYDASYYSTTSPEVG